MFGRWAIILFLLFAHSAQAQDPFAIALTQKDGLPSNSVYQAYQDQKGFMWLATDRGVVRYDGKRFVKPAFDFEKSRAGTEIREDRFGRIWYMNFDGYLFFTSGDRFNALPQNKPIGYTRYGISGDYIFVVQEKGLDVFSIRNLKRIKHFPFNTGVFKDAGMTRNGFLVHSGENAFLINKQLKLVSLGKSDADKIAVNFEAGQEVFRTIAGQNVYYEFIGSNGNRKVVSFPKDQIIQNVSTTPNDLWLSTPQGVIKVGLSDPSSGPFPVYFKDKNVSDVFEDREGNWWICTIQQGIFLVQDGRMRFQFSTHRPFALFRQNSSVSMVDEQAVLYHLSNLQQPLLDLGNKGRIGKLERFYSDEKASFYGIQTKQFYLKDHSGKLLFTDGLAVKDVKQLSNGSFGLAISGLVGVLKLPLNVSSSSWLDRSLEVLNNSPNTNQLRVLKERVRGKCMAEDLFNKCLYFGTNVGFYSFTEKGVREIKWNGETVYVVQLERWRQRLFVLTDSGSLLEVVNGKLVKSVFAKQIENDFTITKIKLCDDVMVLFGEQGLLLLDLKTAQILPVKLAIHAADIIDVYLISDKLYVAISTGVAEIQLSQLMQKRKIQPLFELLNVQASGKSVAHTTLFRLPYDQNDIEIQFALLNYNVRNQSTLRYRINNGTWKSAGKQSGALELVALQPGKYQVDFELDDQLQKERIQFEIIAPFWKRWYFITGLSFLVLASLFLVFRVRVRSIRKRNELEREKVELEAAMKESMLKAVKAQMNPHFLYNALNTIQSFIYEDDKRNASTYLSKFSTLSRMILEMSEQSFVTLENELKALQLYVEIEQARFGDEFHFHIDLDPNIDLKMIKLPPMLIQPYVENAVKHGLLHRKGMKQLDISFECWKEDVLLVRISDNGVGREKSAKINENRPYHQSFSSGANEKRLVLLQRDSNDLHLRYTDLTDENGEAVGTVVELYIPFDK